MEGHYAQAAMAGWMDVLRKNSFLSMTPAVSYIPWANGNRLKEATARLIESGVAVNFDVPPFRLVVAEPRAVSPTALTVKTLG